MGHAPEPQAGSSCNLQAAVACSLPCTHTTVGKGNFSFLSYSLQSHHIRPATSDTRVLGTAGLLLHDPSGMYLSALLTVAGIVVCHGQHQAPTSSRKHPAWRFTFPLDAACASIPVSAITTAKVQVHCLVRKRAAGVPRGPPHTMDRTATVTPVVWTTPSTTAAAAAPTTVKLVCAHSEGAIVLTKQQLPASRGAEAWHIHVRDATSRLWHFHAQKDLEFVHVHALGRAVTRTAPPGVPAPCVHAAQAAWDATLKYVQEELDRVERGDSTPLPASSSATSSSLSGVAATG